MIYLDNSATTHKKPLSTHIAMLKAMTFYCANPSRSSHNLSIRTGQKIEMCRQHIKQFESIIIRKIIIRESRC